MLSRVLCSLAALSIAGAVAAEDLPDSAQVVDTFEKLGGGPHKGLRRNHAKGVCVTGSFTGSAAARDLSDSAWFSGKEVAVVGRFSVAGPNPGVPDAAHAPHGLGLEFRLPKDELQHATMLNVPVFPVKTVQAFYESLRINLPDPATGKPDPAKGKAFAAAHPEAKPFFDYMGSHNPPPSYTDSAYYSLHAFKFTKGKKSHWVKWRFVPEDGEKFMTEAELAAASGDFLDQRLSDKLKNGTAQWEMIVTLGEKGDPIDNPTALWPAKRKEVKAGILTLTKGADDAKGSCEDINFDPNVVSAGVETSPDEILQYRSQAYAESFSRRATEK